jgi:putative transposase
LQGVVKASLESGIQAICGFAGCEVVEMNVRPDPGCPDDLPQE